MTDKLLSTPAAFFATTWGRILAILAAISILMGIGIEAQSLVTGYYNMQRAASEAAIARANATAATAKVKPVPAAVPALPNINGSGEDERNRAKRAARGWKDDGTPSNTPSQGESAYRKWEEK